MSTFKISNTQVNLENVAAAIADNVTTETLNVNTITNTGNISTPSIVAGSGYNSYQTLGTENIVNPPSNTLTVGGVNISALNKRTRTSYGSAETSVNTWTTRTPATDNSWRCVCWSPELSLFCAVSVNGTGNRVMTSPDGINWTTRTPATDNNWHWVCWAAELGLFCAVSNNGSGDRVMTSPDGINWTTRASAADNTWTTVCWSPELSLFCAVAPYGTGDRVMTSPDGINWTSRTPATDNRWFHLCWAAELGLFCAVSITGTGNRVMTSPDGINWTTRASAADNMWFSICWAAELGLFCAVSIDGTGNRVMTSPDGINWTTRASAADNNWFSICWAAELGLFCAVSANGTGNRVMTSPDGINWTTRASAADNEWFTVCWSPELSVFCAVSVSGSGNRVMTSNIGMPNSLSTVKAPPSQITVTPAGNVGINTTTPTEKLNVDGNILATGTITPFTGSHIVQNIYSTEDLGKIVSSTGYISTIELNNSWPITEIASKNQDPSVYGVLSEIKENTALVNGVGEGAVWVCDLGGNIKNGDFITSSSVTGYGQKQVSSTVHNYTVARAIMDCAFDPLETKQDFFYNKYTKEHTKKVKSDFDLKTSQISGIEYYLEYFWDETNETIKVYDSDGDFIVEKSQDIDPSESPKSIVIDLTSKIYKSLLNPDSKTQTYTRVPVLDTQGIQQIKTIQLLDDITNEGVSEEPENVQKFIVYIKEYREWKVRLDDEGNPVTKPAYKCRYVNSDGVEISENEYKSFKANGDDAYVCALVGCIYLCG